MDPSPSSQLLLPPLPEEFRGCKCPHCQAEVDAVYQVTPCENYHFVCAKCTSRFQGQYQCPICAASSSYDDLGMEDLETLLSPKLLTHQFGKNPNRPDYVDKYKKAAFLAFWDVLTSILFPPQKRKKKTNNIGDVVKVVVFQFLRKIGRPLSEQVFQTRNINIPLLIRNNKKSLVMLGTLLTVLLLAKRK